MFRRTTPDPTMSGRRPLQPRLMMATGALLAVGAVGVALLLGSQRPSGEALAEAAASGAAPGPAAPPAAPAGAGIDPGPSSSTTTSTPAASAPAATAGPAPAPALPTGPAGPPPTATAGAGAARARPNPAPPAPPAARPAPAPTSSTSGDPAAQLRQVQAIADTSGWGWRQVHVNFRIGFDPAACCHWGVYDPSDHKTIWIGPTAFDDPARLRYVVLHELAHAWQWHSHRLTKLEADMAPWGYSGLDALEAGADCIATDWGADVNLGHYWACPPAAQGLMAGRLAGQWK